MKKLFTLLALMFCLNANAQCIELVNFLGTTNGSKPQSSLIQASDGMLYGMTYYGGASGVGALFQYNPATNIYTKKFDFNGTNGMYPNGDLIQASDGMLYGMTSKGGAGTSNYGVLFQYNPTTSTYIKKVDFAGVTNGKYPEGSLIQASDGMLYGMISNGGVNNRGIIFQYNPITSTLTDKYDFAGIDGSNPEGSLIQASDGILYGMTWGGGANDSGVIFQYNPASNVYTKKLDFNGTTGCRPWGSLVQASDGMLYGMTFQGGANNYGVLFQYNPTTSTYTNKLDFDGFTNGANPLGSLMQASDGWLYGMTQSGGVNNYGVLFQYNSATNIYTKKLDFAAPTAQNPYGSLMQATDGMLYGMTCGGGPSTNCSPGCGVLFKFCILRPTVTATSNTISLCSDSTAILQAHGATTYTWSTNATTTTIAITPTVTTTYTLIGIDSNDCVNTDTITQIVTNCNTTTEIKYTLVNNKPVSIYPNPTNDSFIIEPNSSAKQTIQIFDVNGKVVLTQIINGKTTIDTSILSEGVYNISLLNSEGVLNKRLVIVK